MLDLEPSRVPVDERDEIAHQIAFYLRLARERLGLDLRPPTFDLALRGVAAGKADLARWHLRFNRTLLLDNREHFLVHTVGHEVAHLVVHARWRRRTAPHGKEWKSVMAAFALPCHVTHRYDVAKVRTRRATFLYRCECNEAIALGPVRHRRARRGTVYFCRRCNTAITPLAPASA